MQQRNRLLSSQKESPDDGLSESSSSSGDSDSSKEGQRERGTFSGNCSPEKSKFMLSPTKTVSDLKGIRIDELSPNLPFPEGVHENDCLAESSEQDQEDGLGSAVTILALALENFERKLASAAKKKSSEILISVSNGIKLQLQNAEFQIQTDLENLTSLSNSKRKHVETRLQETSHKKLISQLEEAVQNQLDDAHRRITAVNELARGKMLQLKRILGQCLKEGILD
ncbi:meiosis-specific protein ASY3 isoform X3 [Carica papaya]|uniref:meiosis-specific protein ASY3 isoform X3 n=1 Tax=Carica papaya TaxID=3649 RepID=UPI000B8C7818|nr:meiosis-specific protein ASY3 isoform X3 [Carica papaya]